MIIGIDGNEANVDKKVGVSVYTSKLLTYYQQKADETTQFRVYLRAAPLRHMPEQNSYFKYEVVPGKIFWSQLFLPLSLNLTRGIDVFFSPAHYAPRFCPVPLVTTIHDIAYFYYPEEFLKKDLYKLQNWTKYSIEKSKKIIAVSKTTKKDIIKFYHTPENKIEVVYNGFEKQSSSDITKVWENLVSKFEIRNSKFLLYVSTLQPRKNVPTLIKAYNKFKIDNPEYKLVIVGKKGWMVDKIMSEIEDQENVIFTGFLSDEEVVALYQHAFCYILPSLYEGFGITILEAMSHGAPVITSYASSLPEVGGEAALYFEPNNIDDLLFNIKLLHNDKQLRKDMIEKGKERIKNFSWSTCASETLQIIESAALSS